MAQVRYSESIDVGVKPDVVFAYRLDYTNLPAYNPDVTDLARVDTGTEPGPGATYSFTSHTDYGDVPGKITVVEVDFPKRLVHELDFGLTGNEVCTFEAIDDGTRVRFDVTIVVPEDLDQAGRDFIENSGRKPVRMELENIKKILES